LPEGVRIVERTGSVLAAHRLPDEAGGVHHCAVDDRTRNIAEQADGRLYHTHGHGLICGDQGFD